jgi:hypothetical protein
MKKIIFAFAVTGICSTLNAQETLSDRWKETKRTDLTNKTVSYTDTLRLSDVSKDGMNIRRGAFQYKGQISNDLFEVGDLQFGIMKNDKEEMIKKKYNCGTRNSYTFLPGRKKICQLLMRW